MYIYSVYKYICVKQQRVVVINHVAECAIHRYMMYISVSLYIMTGEVIKGVYPASSAHRVCSIPIFYSIVGM